MNNTLEGIYSVCTEQCFTSKDWMAALWPNHIVSVILMFGLENAGHYWAKQNNCMIYELMEN